jgi:hypothetical protein
MNATFIFDLLIAGPQIVLRPLKDDDRIEHGITSDHSLSGNSSERTGEKPMSGVPEFLRSMARAKAVTHRNVCDGVCGFCFFPAEREV